MTVSPEDVTTYIRSIGGEPAVQNGTEDFRLDAALDHWGIRHASINWSGVAGALASGAIVRCLIHDNGNADPDPFGGFEHWVNIIDAAPGGWRVHNPWGGRDILYGDRVLRVATIELTAIFLDGIKPDLTLYPFWDQLVQPDADDRELCGETTTAAAITCLLASRAKAANAEDAPMTGTERTEAYRAAAWLAYLGVLHRQPSNNERDYWVGQAQANKWPVDVMVYHIANAPESVRDEAADYKRDNV